KSVEAIRLLNEKGYAQPGSPLILNLVYNPQGTNLPPSQENLQREYKKHLHDEYGINFNQLFTLTNMPIQRFAHQLRRQQQLEYYYRLLEQNYQEQNLAEVMCRHLISIDWQGYVYDCDFNQMLALPLGGLSPRPHVKDLQAEYLLDADIRTGRHCFGCTAGQGSSCGGALNKTENS
ncbi:MAG TPA: radical SAM protein, partial [Gammaproteobacteria bacterium]|nr:radical SAM protein [Gammaproteobacteria bacterium]